MDAISREELFNQFQTASNLMRRYLYRVRTNQGDEVLEHGQGRLMRILAKDGGLSQKELAEKMRIRPASLSELLGKLESKGYILRKRNEADKRVYNYWLSGHGQEAAARTEETKREYGQTVFSELGDAEAETLYSLLQKVSHSLEGKLAEKEQ